MRVALLWLVACSAAPTLPPPPLVLAPPAPNFARYDAGSADGCDGLVATVMANEGLTNLSSDEPLCQWRLDEARSEALAVKFTHVKPVWPTHVFAQAGAGRLDEGALIPQLEGAGPAVVACTATPKPLRVQFTVSEAGVVSGVLLDFRQTFAADVAPCVERVLTVAKLARPAGGNALLRYTFDPKR